MNLNYISPGLKYHFEKSQIKLSNGLAIASTILNSKVIWRGKSILFKSCSRAKKKSCQPLQKSVPGIYTGFVMFGGLI